MYLLILVFIVCLSDFVYGIKKIECGYKQCPQTREGALNVHLIPHSHMDAGWVKTFDEYYYGTKASTSSANVQLIYHSVLSELLHDKRRKFTFSESAYFWRWWKEQRPITRATFRILVQEGRVEFAGGGWVQNDEATTDYLQIIDQFTWGLRKLNDTLGPCGKPKAAWQIDTYGHSREQVSLLAQMGYDGLFIGRVDHREREAMIEEDRMEFMWRGSDVLGKMSDIMTHTLYNLYNAPDGFCFDFLCNDEPIIDDPDNKVFNADKRVNDFIAQIEKQAKYYDHDNILVTMGGDFTYQSAAHWFMNLDKLINHVNTHPANMSDINIFYSTPSCYLKALYLYGRRDKAMYTERDDHLPYGSDISTYWTGYYTSRPTIKYLARRAHIFLQVMKQLTVISRAGDSFELHLLRHATSLMLHHDAITGTSQQHVAHDFVRLISEAIDACTKKISSFLGALTPTWGGSRRSKNTQQFVICHQLNMSQCRFLENQDAVLMLVYNPSSMKTYHYVRIPAIALHYSIRDFNDEEVEYQLVPLPTAIINLPGRSSLAIQELVFEAENIPPLGFSAYYVAPVHDQLEENAYVKKKAAQEHAEPEQEMIPYISNEYLKVIVNKETGLLETIQHVDGITLAVSQNLYYYSPGQPGLQSGAYSFRPEKDRPTPVTERVQYNAVRGSLIKEIRQRFNDWITQVIRLYRGEEFLEIEWIIGPVPIGTDLGKEVVSVFTTNITNNGEFFTDSNGRQMIKRTCWNDSVSLHKKPIAACYFPVTSRVCIHSLNSSVEMCVLPDRTQGATSFNDGEIEIMLHRRLLTDDGFGLEETLNEEAHGVGLVVRGKHRILFGNFRQEIDEQTFSERSAQAARRWQLEPWLFFTSGDKINRRKWQNLRNKRYSSLLLHGLPRHVHILTLEPWKAGSVLLRLENTLERPVRGNLKDKLDNMEAFSSKASHVTVELKKIFLHMKIRMVRETTLAANQWLDDARQMDWSTRYVYSGGEDGILPEDVADLNKDSNERISKNDQKDQDMSDEENENPRRRKVPRKLSEKLRSKSKNRRNDYEYDRRKRSINITENINENIINKTYDDPPKIGLDFVNSTVESLTSTTLQDFSSLALNVSDTTEKYQRNTRKNFRLSFLNKPMKPSLIFTAAGKDSEEMDSSEENFSSNLKKRMPKRKKSNKPRPADYTIDDSDDGVTKSMYEMYYKASKIASRPHFRIREEKKTKKRKPKFFHQTNDYEDNSAEATTKRFTRVKSRRKVKSRVDMPFFVGIDNNKREDSVEERKGRERVEPIDDEIPKGAYSYYGHFFPEIPYSRAKNREKRRKPVYSQEYDEPDSRDEENEYSDICDKKHDSRRKRDIPKDEDAESTSETSERDAEYVITLRPTQIRTFVVWFQETKKTFVN